jgi:phosphomannomutase/phosphoglucomutase
LQSTGVDVIDLGVVVTPMVYFGTNVLGATSGIMVTGSHNPPDYNGFKMVLAGEAIYGDAILACIRPY